MATKDSRRITAPEKSRSYVIYQEKSSEEFLRSDGVRLDGRSAADIRRYHCNVGMISQAKGSSYVEIGTTKVLCGIYGPKEVLKTSNIKLLGQVQCEVKMAPFSCRMRKSAQPDRQQKELSLKIKESLEAVILLEKYPKCQIEVFISVIEDGGSLLSTCLTAAGLALCHAHIEVYDLLVGTSVMWVNGVLYIDPSLKEEEWQTNNTSEKSSEGTGHLDIGVMPLYGNGQIVLMNQTREMSVDALCQGINSAVETAQRIYTLARQTLLNHVHDVLDDIEV